MSFDFPTSVQQDIQQYANAEHISADEALLKLVQSGLKAAKRKSKGRELVTDELLSQLKAVDPSFGLLEDVPEEKIERMSTTIQRMKKVGFESRA